MSTPVLSRKQLEKQLKKIIEQLSSTEKKKLKKYEKAHNSLGKKMLKAQMKYSQYVLKNDSNSLKARKLADKGFEYEYKAFKATDDLVEYKKQLIQKYKKS